MNLIYVDLPGTRDTPAGRRCHRSHLALVGGKQTHGTGRLAQLPAAAPRLIRSLKPRVRLWGEQHQIPHWKRGFSCSLSPAFPTSLIPRHPTFPFSENTGFLPFSKQVQSITLWTRPTIWPLERAKLCCERPLTHRLSHTPQFPGAFQV